MVIFTSQMYYNSLILNFKLGLMINPSHYFILYEILDYHGYNQLTVGIQEPILVRLNNVVGRCSIEKLKRQINTMNKTKW